MISDRSIGQTFWTTSDNGLRQRRLAVGILFVEIKAVRFPVFVEQRYKSNAAGAPARRCAPGPRRIGDYDSRDSNPCPRRSRADSKVKPAGFKHGQKTDFSIRRPMIFVKQSSMPPAARPVRPHEFRRSDVNADWRCADCELKAASDGVPKIRTPALDGKPPKSIRVAAPRFRCRATRRGCQSFRRDNRRDFCRVFPREEFHAKSLRRKEICPLRGLCRLKLSPSSLCTVFLAAAAGSP